MSLYTVRSPGYKIIKFDGDLNPVETYETGLDACTCPAHKFPCRHVTILGLFLETQRVDSGWLFDWEGGKRWLPPLENDQ
jgi:hypothetical protein